MKCTLKLQRILLAVVSGYIVLTLLLVLAEPHMVYQPFSGTSEPAEAGLKNFTRKTLPQAGLPTITYWENHAQKSAPTVLYFHGNGGGLFLHAKALAFFDAAKLHVVAMEYPSYPSAEGKPNELTILAQANALWEATAKTTTQKPAIWGFSLGSGVATQLAAKHHPSALILEAPFTAVVDRASEIFPLIPVHWLMKNQYRSHDVIAQVNAPLFILHGDADYIIPIHHGRDLFALAKEPKTFKEYQGFGHLNLEDSGAYDDAVAFIRARP